MKKSILLILVAILLTVVFCGCEKSNNSKENGFDENVSEFSDSQVIEYLENQGYVFEISEHTAVYTTKYVFVSNAENGIVFQKYINPLIGTHYTWKNGDINDEWADIRSEYENEKDEEKQQYKEYKKWLKFQGLSSAQLTSALDFYEEHSN